MTPKISSIINIKVGIQIPDQYSIQMAQRCLITQCSNIQTIVWLNELKCDNYIARPNYSSRHGCLPAWKSVTQMVLWMVRQFNYHTRIISVTGDWQPCAWRDRLPFDYFKVLKFSKIQFCGIKAVKLEIITLHEET